MTCFEEVEMPDSDEDVATAFDDYEKVLISD